jgi:hypothetical protein
LKPVCVHSPDLLTDQLGGSSVVLPLPQEQLAEKRIQRLLLVAILFAPAGVLLLQGGQEPLEHQERSLRGVGFLGGRSEDGRVFAPVRAELSQAGGREDEGRRGEA